MHTRLPGTAGEGIRLSLVKKKKKKRKRSSRDYSVPDLKDRIPLFLSFLLLKETGKCTPVHFVYECKDFLPI